MISSEDNWAQQGEFVDFRDKDNNPWQVGYVLSRTKNIIKIRTEGWSSKFDEFLQLPTPARLKPFRTHVRGYTGQVKNPAMREHWKFSSELQKQNQEFFQQFMTNQSQKNEHQIKQFITGQHYFWIDFLLTVNYSTSQHLLQAYQYLKGHILFAKKYMQQMCDCGLSNWFGQNLNLSENQKAYRECFYQIMDGLYILTGINVRQLNFQKNNEIVIKNAIKESLTHEKFMTKFMLDSGLQKTYTRLLTMLQKETFEENKQFPIPFFYQVLHIYSTIQKLLLQKTEEPFNTPVNNKQQRKKLAIRLFTIIKKQMEYITPSHLKSHQNEKQLELLFSEINLTCYKYSLEQIAYEWIEKTKIKVAFLLIQCDTLQRKLKGIQKLKDLYENLITVNQFQMFKLPYEIFIELLSDHRVVQSLFENNQHPQILKKGSQLVLLLFKSHFIEISSLIHIWNASVQKHQAVKKIVYQLWNELTSFITSVDLEKFIQPIIKCDEKMSEDELTLFVQEWQIEMLINFGYNLMKQYEEEGEKKEKIEKIFAVLLQFIYKRILLMEKSNQLKTMVNNFAKIVNVTLLSNQIIKKAYIFISKNQYVKLNLELLISFYQESFEKATYLPPNAIQIIFLAFQSPKNFIFSSTIFQLMDQIINFSLNIAGNYILSQQQFNNLWQIAHKSDEIKGQFYSWLVKKNSQGLFGIPVYQINANIPQELKSSIFKNFLCDYNKMDYFNMTIEELHIFKEFMLFENQQEDKIEVKRLMNLIKIPRIKNPDINGNKYMWDIFLNCKNQSVIKELSKMILALHFNYHDSCDNAIKKAKVGALMVKLQKHLRDGLKKGNIKLMKHSLILLKDVIDFVKEKRQPRQIISSVHQNFKVTIKILFQGKKLEQQIFFGSTFHEIKGKIAELIKLQRSKFQMISMKNEEISLQLSEIPFCFNQEMTIKVVRVEQDEQTIPSLVLNFTKDRIENILIDMLEDQTICESVYNVLQDIQVKVEQGEKLLEKLIAISQKHMRQNNEGLSKQAVYIQLFYIRIISFMLDKTGFLQKFIKNKLFNRLVDKLFVSLHNPLIVIYFFNYMDIIFQILKRYKAKSTEDLQVVELIQSVKTQLIQKSICVIDVFNDYLNNQVQSAKMDPKKVRIIFNSLSIIDELENENFVFYFANHPKFNGIIRKIYLKNNLNEVALIFTEKIRKSLVKLKGLLQSTNEESNKCYEEIISIFAKLYISDLFNQIQEKDGSYSDKKKILHYYKMVNYIISSLNGEQFSHFIIGQNDQHFHLYQLILKSLKNCRDSSESTQPANYVLSANLIMLAAIYRKKPSLMTNQMLHYIIYDCLFNKIEQSSSNETNCKKADNIKNALDVLEAGIIDTDSSKIISTIKNIQQFHKISYWRNSEYWSTSIQNEVKGQFVGLQNLGCICYMNSLLQQLFMTKNFRNSILSLSLKDHPESERVQMLNAMKELFFNLIHSDEIALNPLFFIKTIKSHDNKPLIKIFVQMDIDQFCSILFDKVENQLQHIPNQINIVKNIFGGIYAHEIISKECKHCSQRQEQFISIGLEVKKSILQSFNALIKGQMLDGQNKYYCEKCDKKVKAEKILTIKKLPPNLILSLKRFEYNYQIDAKIKINDYCQFPMQLNLKKFSQQQINKSQVPQNLDISEQTNTAQSELPDSYFLYRLKGVVVHTGSADSGHYYSLIQDTENKWFQFNDSHVSPFDPENLADEAFGSKDSMEEKVKNAYLLFYERVQHQPQIEKMAQLQETNQNTDIISKIISKNKTISKFRLLFSHDYSDFVDYLEKNIKNFDLSMQEYQDWHQFLITYYLLIKIRQGQIDDLLDLSKVIHDLIKKDKRFSQLFLNAVVQFNFLEEVFVFGSNRDKVKVIGSLLTTSFFNYLADIPDNYSALRDTIVEKLLICISKLTIIHGNISELQIFLRTVIESGKEKSDNRILKYIVQQLHFEKSLLNNLLGFNIPKQEKQKALQYKEEQKDAINPLLGSSKNEGKKYLPSQSKESWHILWLILQYLEPSQIAEEDVEQNQHLKSIKIQIDKIIKSGTLPRIIHECGASRSIYRLYNVFKYLKKRQYLIEAIEKGLKDFESTKYRQLLLLLYLIILDKQTSEKIILLIIEMLQKVQAVNEKYFIEVNLLHQWIINYINASPLFLKSLSENQGFLNKIINWIKAKPLPSLQLIKKHKNPMNQKLSNRLNGILVSADPKDYDTKSKILKHKFTQILYRNNQFTGSSYDWESQYLDKFTPQVDAYYFNHSSKSWNRVKVIENNFGYLKLQEYGESKTPFNLWSDNQKLSPFKQNVAVTEQQLQSGSQQQIEQKMDVIDEQQDLYH